MKPTIKDCVKTFGLIRGIAWWIRFKSIEKRVTIIAREKTEDAE